MFKIDSWPPEPGNVHIDEITAAELVSDAERVRNREVTADDRMASFNRIGHIGAQVGRFVSRNSTDGLEGQYALCEAIASELPGEFTQSYELIGQAKLEISVSWSHKNLGDNQ